MNKKLKKLIEDEENTTAKINELQAHLKEISESPPVLSKNSPSVFRVFWRLSHIWELLGRRVLIVRLRLDDVGTESA